MIDEQIRKIMEKTFSEIDNLVKEVQQKKKEEAIKCGERNEERKSLVESERE
ncbi:MAG: hypothetical protein SCH71_02145 [Desulfobulbaceae bacterium]|nr:hypothetical protein [Desulfobulbaceae bacterium]